MCFFASPSSGSINLLEWFTELRETLYLLIIKDITKDTDEQQMEKMNRARHVERGSELPSLLQCATLYVPPCVQLFGISPNPVLLFFFLWRLHYVGMTDVHHWPLVFNSTFSLSPFLRGWGMRLKVSALYFIWLGFLWQSALILRLSRTPTHLLPHYTKRHKHVPDHHNKGILQ